MNLRRLYTKTYDMVAVFVGRGIGGRGDIELECNEPEPEPVACIVFVCKSIAEHLLEKHGEEDQRM